MGFSSEAHEKTSVYSVHPGLAKVKRLTAINAHCGSLDREAIMLFGDLGLTSTKRV